MANNYVQFSEILQLDSDEEKDWFERYLAASSTNGVGWDDESNPISKEAKFWDNTLDNDDESAGFYWKIQDDGICLYSEESGNPHHVACLVQQFLKEMRPTANKGFSIGWAEVCSEPRAGEFGGGAIFVTKEKIHYMSVWQWLDDMALKNS